MSGDTAVMQIQTLSEQYQTYYEQRIMSGEMYWNDAVFRMETEQQWLDTEIDGVLNRTLLRDVLAEQSLEEWYVFVKSQLEQGKMLMVNLIANCTEQDSARMLHLLQSYLTDELFLRDWDAPCTQTQNLEMERFAEAIQLMECVLPEAFSQICLQWIHRIPLENEYIPELLLKGLVHTAEDSLMEFLQSPSYHNGIKIGLLNYICESPVRQEGIYTFLKTMFKQSQDPDEKHFLGILLGEYGDSRAIPVLRKYLEFLIRTEPTNVQALQEIASAIYKLGGQYEDLMHN